MSDKPNDPAWDATSMVLVPYRLQMAETRIEEQDKHIEKLEDDFKKFQRQMDEKERRNLAWGVGTLGTVVITLAGVIWSYRSVIFR